MSRKKSPGHRNGTNLKLPVIILHVPAARMQEGILSLMQMAKPRRQWKLMEGRLPYFADYRPATGGVSGQLCRARRRHSCGTRCLIGFAGRSSTDNWPKLPEGFQRAEFMLEHGLSIRSWA
ncbi:MAG: hypothetical protein ACLSFZ_02580 [Frisingicoccus sp.]